jgi:hypothetical protein
VTGEQYRTPDGRELRWRPSSGEPVSARITNAGAALGGLCFLVGALLLMPEAVAAQNSALAEATGSGQAEAVVGDASV